MVRRSIAFALIDRYAGMVLSLATMAIVARLLTPAEVGLFMVASAAVILLEAFRDFGVGACLIQATVLTPRLVRTAVTVMALLSLTLGALLWITAGPIASFYGEPKLAAMVRIATLGFVVAPVSNPLLALMRRDLAFGRLAAISIGAASVNSAVTIGLALLGFSSASLVWASVAQAAVLAAGTLILRPDFWIFRPSLAEWRHILPFGAWSSTVTLLGLLSEFMPRLILGRLISLDAVGLFTRALALCQLPDRALLGAIQPVILPTLAARARAGANLKEPYLLGLASVTALQWPALLCLALLAEPIVRILLGGQWLEVVPLVRILALAALGLFPSYLGYPVLVAVGRVRDLAMASLIALPPSLAALLFATRFGLQAVALSYLLIWPVQIVVGLYYVRKRIRFSWSEFARALLPSGAAAVGAALAPALILLFSQSSLGFAETAVAMLGAGAGWLAALRLSNHPLDSEVRLMVVRLRARLPRRAGWDIS